jgi:chemotaxis protein CheD
MTSATLKPQLTEESGPAEILEFATLRRRFYFDRRFNATMVWVSQGDFYVTQNPNEVITTVLGSCVAVCVRDPDLKIGGMNHFLLPKAADNISQSVNNDLRYGSYSIERLVNNIMSHGGRRDRLEIKIFGGASIATDFHRVGEKNAEFVVRYLEREGLTVSAKDLRGHSARRVMYFPNTGKVMVSSGRDQAPNRIFELENDMQDKTVLQPSAKTSILFGRD